MVRRLALAFAGVLALMAAPVSAQAGDWSGEAGLVSDYRYRGLSLSSDKPALQAELTYEHRSGLYLDLWGSTLGGNGIELDPAIGYSANLGRGLSADVSATYYVYPDDGASNAIETTLALEAERESWTLAGGVSLAPAQRGTRDEFGTKCSNAYLFTKAAYTFPKLPLTARAEIGRESGPWDMRSAGAKWDWTLGLDWNVGAGRLSLEHVGSSAGPDGFVGALRLAL